MSDPTPEAQTTSTDGPSFEALVNAWKILFREADRCAAERAAAEQEKEAA